MKLLPTADEATIVETLAQEFPDLVVRSIRFLHKLPDRCSVEVNEQLIFKFPLGERAPLEMRRELWVLNALRRRMSVAIPQPDYVLRSIRGFGYNKIPGVLLTDDYYWSLTIQQRQAFAAAIARFLCELHDVLGVADALAAGLASPGDPLNTDQLRERILPILNQKEQTLIVERILERYKQLDVSSEPCVVLHNDLHGWNIVCKLYSAQLAGVFDFNGVCVGDAHLDFRYFFYPDPSLLELVLTHYRQMSGCSLSLHRCILYAATTELSDLVYCTEEGRKIYGGPISTRITRLEQQLQSYNIL